MHGNRQYLLTNQFVTNESCSFMDITGFILSFPRVARIVRDLFFATSCTRILICFCVISRYEIFVIKCRKIRRNLLHIFYQKKKIQKYTDEIYTRVVGNEWLIIRIERTLLVYYSGRYYLFSIIVVLFNLCFNWYCIVKKNRFCNAESYRYIVFVFNTFTVGRIFIRYATRILTNPFHLKSIFCMV